MSRGARARLSVFLTASSVAGTLTALSGLARAPVTADGDAVMGFGLGLVLLSFVGGFYWTSLGPWRWLVPATIGANVVLSRYDPKVVDAFLTDPESLRRPPADLARRPSEHILDVLLEELG